jgi:uncharacterized protein YecT (DUF1311 family)
MATCTSDLQGSKEALDAALGDLRAHVTGEYLNQLDQAQRTWTTYRDALCIWEASGSLGSTSQDADVIACTADMNRERAKYLKDDLKNRW